MKTTTSARNLARTGMLLLLGTAVAACASSTPIPSARSTSEVPVASPPTSATASPITSTLDPTAGWLSFHSAVGRFSFLYDPAWTLIGCPASEPPLILFGGNVCGQNEPSFYVDSVPAAQAPRAADLRCDSSQPPAITSSVSVDGVTGTREYVDYTTGAYDNCRHPVTHALAYLFYQAGRAYTVMYLYIPSAGPDQTSEVDQMVQTLTFSST